MVERTTPPSSGPGDELHPIVQWPARHIAPRAAALDRSEAELGAALDAAARAGALGLQAPRSLGGLGLRPEEFARWTIEAARASGTFAFVQTQHQSATRLMSAFDQPVRRHVPALATGAVRCGISFGWLRRDGPPAVRARPAAGGFQMEGQIPWFTGHGFFSHCVSAARLPDQRIVLLFHRIDGPDTEASPPMATAAFSAARTVTLNVASWVPEEDVLAILPADWLVQLDPTKVVRQGTLILGTAWAALDLLGEAVDSGRAPALAEARDHARGQLSTLDGRVMDAVHTLPPDALRLRTDCIASAGRLAHAAVAAWSGRSTAPHHAAQRIYREVLGFTVLSQTAAVRDATVEHLLRG